MENIYLCDIDGTLANHEGIRSPYDETKVLQDTPLPTCEVIKSLYLHGNRIIFFSGRTKACFQSTKHWISKYTYIFLPELYMREIGDDRPDEILKRELYDTHIKDKYNVIALFDDRLKVCRMWWDLGLFVFCCNQGLKEF